MIYATDGMIIRLILSDPLLSNFSVIMIDDVHERTLNTDLLLALLKRIRRKRKDLKIIISSATMQSEKILEFFTE